MNSYPFSFLHCHSGFFKNFNGIRAVFSRLDPKMGISQGKYLGKRKLGDHLWKRGRIYGEKHLIIIF